MRLQFSPSKTANDILATLRSGSNFEKIKCLKELSSLSTDLTFALEFINKQGLVIIINLIEDSTQKEDDILKYSLCSFVELMEHGTVSWEILQDSFVQRNIQIVCNFQQYPKECTESALSNLENIVANSRKHALVEQGVTLQDLLRLLQDAKSSVIAQNGIALINALFMKSDEGRKRYIAQTISAKQYRLALIGNISGTEMSHQLYVLQTLTLGLLEQRMRTKMNAQDQDAHEKIKELRRIAFEDYSGVFGDDTLRRGGGNQINNGGNVNFSHLYKKLGFKCDINPAQDFMETPPGKICFFFFLMKKSRTKL